MKAGTLQAIHLQLRRNIFYTVIKGIRLSIEVISEGRGIFSSNDGIYLDSFHREKRGE